MSTAFTVHGRQVQKGEHLRDENGILCRVESVSEHRLLTRTREYGEYRNRCAEWTPEQFASLQWWRAHPRQLKQEAGSR